MDREGFLELTARRETRSVECSAGWGRQFVGLIPGAAATPLISAHEAGEGDLWTEVVYWALCDEAGERLVADRGELDNVPIGVLKELAEAALALNALEAEKKTATLDSTPPGASRSPSAIPVSSPAPGSSSSSSSGVSSSGGGDGSTAASSPSSPARPATIVHAR